MSGDTGSLIELQRNYLLTEISQIQTPHNLKYLILDERSEKLVNSLIDRNELLRYVTVVERIDEQRKFQPSVEAVYLLEPTNFNLNCLLADTKVSPTRYKGGHLLFLEGFTEEMQAKLNSARAYIRSFKTVYFNMFPKESRAFISDHITPNPIPIYYSKDCFPLVNAQVESVCRSLVNMMIILGEYPLIRYYSPKSPINQSSVLPKIIADTFQRKIDDYARQNADYPPPSNRPRCVVMITDRTLDLFAPLLHEFTYQSMAYDVINFKYGDTYVYETENEANQSVKKEAKLEDSDTDWRALRHLHILESSEAIVQRVNELIVKNPLMVDRSNATTSTDLLYIVAHLKGFDEERRRITLHKKLIDECLAINGERKLAESADFEQNCVAGGLTFEGDKCKGLAGDLIDLLTQPHFSNTDKLRFILIYALYRGGLFTADFKKLLALIQFQNVDITLELFQNFTEMGFKLVKPDLKAKSFKKTNFHIIDNEGAYNTSRFEPAINSVIEQQIQSRLDEKSFPYFRDKPLEDETAKNNAATNNGATLRNPRHKASWAKSATKFQAPRQRIIYYVAGGMTHSEMRSVYQLSDSLEKDIYIGSETILTPLKFINGVGDISKARDKLKLPIDILARMPQNAPDYLLEPPKPVSKAPTSTPPTIQSQQQTQSKPVTKNHISTNLEEPREKEKKKSRLRKMFK